MTHNILLKYDWVVIFNGKHFTAYQLGDKVAIIWDNGKSGVYDV